MPPLSLAPFSTTMKNYVQTLNANNDAIAAAVNTLQAQVLASVGEGADLILDMFDKPGVVGAASYVLDEVAYAGGATISCGRRPVYNPALGQADDSIAWGVFGGEKGRVKKTGDQVMDASGITTGLPKTIYLGVGSDGVPQFFENNTTPSVVYVYSMTWDGFGLSQFKRTCPILPGSTLIEAMAGRVTQERTFDNETDWLSDTESATAILMSGDGDDNEIGVEGSAEVVGFFVHVDKASDDGFKAPAGPHSDLVLRVVTDTGDVWSASNITIGCDSVPDDFFVAVDPGIGDRRFVTEVMRFYLERVSIGSAVVSARCFTWGVLCKPLYGMPAPKDSAKVDQV